MNRPHTAYFFSASFSPKQSWKKRMFSISLARGAALLLDPCCQGEIWNTLLEKQETKTKQKAFFFSSELDKGLVGEWKSIFINSRRPSVSSPSNSQWDKQIDGRSHQFYASVFCQTWTNNTKSNSLLWMYSVLVKSFWIKGSVDLIKKKHHTFSINQAESRSNLNNTSPAADTSLHDLNLKRKYFGFLTKMSECVAEAAFAVLKWLILRNFCINNE